MHDPRNNLANQVSTQLVTHFTNQVYRTIIPRNVRLAEAPSHGLPIHAVRPDLQGRGVLSGPGERGPAPPSTNATLPPDGRA